MRPIRQARAAIRNYTHHPDPRVRAANLIAIIVASNQPVYPLYIWWLVSPTIWPSFYTFLSTPFFLAVPALSRRSPIMGRALLPLAGIGNTIQCASLFGVRSAVEIFLIPCAVLSLLLFRPAERMTGFAIAGLAMASYLLLHGQYGAPAVSYGAAEYEAFARLNVLSAAALAAFAALVFSNLLADAENSAQSAGGPKAS